MPDPSSSPVQIDLEAADSFRRVAHVKVEPAHMESLRDRVARKLAKRVRMDGFRPGKVPVAVVRKQMPAAVEQDAIEELVPQVYKKILDENEDLHPIADPRVENFDMPEGEPLHFDLVIEVRPDLEVTGFEAVEVTRYLPPIDDERVDKAIVDMADREATWSVLEEGGAAEGDALRMDTVPLDADKNPIEEDTADDQVVLVGGDGNLPEINAALLGMQVGEETDVEITYPADYPNEDLAGSTRVIRLKIKEIRRKILPVVDDAFAQEHSDNETLAELREDIRERMVKGVKRESDRNVREQIVDRLLAINSVPVPPSLERRYLDAMLHDAIHRQPGVDPDDHDHDISDEVREKFDEAYRSVAQRAVRKMILIDNLRRHNDVQVSDEELDARIAEMAEEQGTTAEQMRSLIERARNMDRLRSDMEEDKVFAMLEEKATIHVKEELPPAPESMPTQQDEAQDQA